MRISKLPNLFLALLACATAAAQAFDYDDIADGRFRPVQLAGIRPTADGEHYTTIRDGNIFRHRYAVDDAGTALLPAAAEEGAVALDSLDRATGTWCDAGSRRLDIADYAIAPDGGVLVADGAEPIYRHSFTTRYLYYDGRRLRELQHRNPTPRDAVNPRHLSQTVTVVGRRTIEADMQQSLLPTLTEHVPGLFTTSRGVMGYGVSDGSAGAISLRGLNGSAGRMMVLFDGHPQYA